MDRKRALIFIGKILVALCLLAGMFMSSGFALLGMAIMNLTVTILSFDELFIESPFNQTSIATIKANMTPVVYTGMFIFMVGLLLAITCALMIFALFFTDISLKKESSK